VKKEARVSYGVNVTATDNGRCCGGTTSKASRGLVVFEVKQINNNAPRFSDCKSYSPTVPENDDIGTFVIQVYTYAYHTLALTRIFVVGFFQLSQSSYCTSTNLQVYMDSRGTNTKLTE